MKLKSHFLVASMALLFCIFPVSANPSSTNSGDDSDALDFLVMNVCLDANGRPTLQNPLNTNKAVPHWVSQRNLRPGELLPYYASAWTTGDQVGSRRYSLLGSMEGSDQNGTKYPIIIGWTDHSFSGEWSPKNNVSVMTVQDGYASDMGSTGGNILSVNFGPGYLNPANKGIARFNRAWVFFPQNLIPLNEVRYGVFSEQLANCPRGQFNPIVFLLRATRRRPPPICDLTLACRRTSVSGLARIPRSNWTR